MRKVRSRLTILLLILVPILVIHDFLSSVAFLRNFRGSSMPSISGFILRFEKKTGKKSRKYRCGDSSRCCFQPACEDSQETILIHGFPDALGKGVSESGEGDRCSCTREFSQRLVYAYRPQDNACNHIGNQDPCRCQFCSVNEDLTNQAEEPAHQKRFQIVHLLTAFRWIGRLPPRDTRPVWEVPAGLR